MRPDERYSWIAIIWIFSILLAFMIGRDSPVGIQIFGPLLAGLVLVMVMRIAYHVSRKNAKERSNREQ